MEDVRPLTPVKAEEDDARIMSGADKTELTPALEASSSALLDAKDVIDADKKEKLSSGNVPNPLLMKRRTRRKQKAHCYGNSSGYRRDNIKTVAPAVRQNATSSAATESEKNPIWFTLVALQDQNTDAPLPQTPSRYFRVKDSIYYLAMKLNLESKNEVLPVYSPLF
ncbi:unnamed protein product [Brassica rapa]|uniref:Uncharacterized protein n=1 Tax=Brassica campestris TaxID=3711 RepID=A0A3P6ATB9_BRACM|nr:unnamed protein product [Brassica rapa]VDC95932.1 unnamed protein product [Brassica rapa]